MSDSLKSEEVDIDINAFAINLCNSTFTLIRHNEEAKEKLNYAKASHQKDYENLIEIISYLIERLDVDEFKCMVTTDLKLRSIIGELKAKLCNLDNI